MQSSPASKITQHGFTLIEVLVALAIFAVLSLAGWKVFDGVIKIRERNQAYTEQLSALQSTYSLMLRDFSQAVARPARQSSEYEPALIIEPDKIVFTRMGAFDPTQRSSSTLERVTYQYDAAQQRLIRSSYHNPDQARTQTPPVSVLFTYVSNFSVQALDPGESNVWPPQTSTIETSSNPNIQLPQGDDRLPLGLQVQFTLDDKPLLWRFSLVKKLPQTVPVSNSSTSNNNGSIDNSNNSSSSTNSTNPADSSLD